MTVLVQEHGPAGSITRGNIGLLTHRLLKISKIAALMTMLAILLHIQAGPAFSQSSNPQASGTQASGSQETALSETDSAAAHGISMYGEPAEPADFDHLSYANPNAPQGGKISYGVIGTFDNVNPFILKSIRTTSRGMWDPEFGHLVFQSLMMRSQDEPFTLYGLLAQKAEMPDDRSWIEFTLNPNAKWHDGKPVTPEDVIFTYELLTEKGRPPFSSRTKRIEKIEQTGDLKVKFTFNKDSNREFPLIIAGFTPVLPKHATNIETFADSTLVPLVGSGPYKVKSVDAGKKIVYEKDPGLLGQGFAFNERPVQLR